MARDPSVAVACLHPVLRSVVVAGTAAFLLAGAGALAVAQDGGGTAPSPHGFQLGAGLAVGRPYLLGDMGDVWRGVGTIKTGLGRDVTLDYYGDRVGFGLAVEWMPTGAGDHSALAISGALLMHWRPAPAHSAWQPMISVGYARFYFGANAVRVSELTGKAADLGAGADPYVLGDGGRVEFRVGHDLVKHLRIVLHAQADAVVLERSLHALHREFRPDLGVSDFTELRSAGWAIFPQVGIQLQWDP